MINKVKHSISYYEKLSFFSKLIDLMEADTRKERVLSL